MHNYLSSSIVPTFIGDMKIKVRDDYTTRYFFKNPLIPSSVPKYEDPIYHINKKLSKISQLIDNEFDREVFSIYVQSSFYLWSHPIHQSDRLEYYQEGMIPKRIEQTYTNSLIQSCEFLKFIFSQNAILKAENIIDERMVIEVYKDINLFQFLFFNRNVALNFSSTFREFDHLSSHQKRNIILGIIDFNRNLTTKPLFRAIKFNPIPDSDLSVVLKNLIFSCTDKFDQIDVLFGIVNHVEDIGDNSGFMANLVNRNFHRTIDEFFKIAHEIICADDSYIAVEERFARFEKIFGFTNLFSKIDLTNISDKTLESLLSFADQFDKDTQKKYFADFFAKADNNFLKQIFVDPRNPLGIRQAEVFLGKLATIFSDHELTDFIYLIKDERLKKMFASEAYGFYDLLSENVQNEDHFLADKEVQSLTNQFKDPTLESSSETPVRGSLKRRGVFDEFAGQSSKSDDLRSTRPARSGVKRKGDYSRLSNYRLER